MSLTISQELKNSIDSLTSFPDAGDLFLRNSDNKGNSCSIILSFKNSLATSVMYDVTQVSDRDNDVKTFLTDAENSDELIKYVNQKRQKGYIQLTRSESDAASNEELYSEYREEGAWTVVSKPNELTFRKTGLDDSAYASFATPDSLTTLPDGFMEQLHHVITDTDANHHQILAIFRELPQDVLSNYPSLILPNITTRLELLSTLNSSVKTSDMQELLKQDLMSSLTQLIELEAKKQQTLLSLEEGLNQFEADYQSAKSVEANINLQSKLAHLVERISQSDIDNDSKEKLNQRCEVFQKNVNSIVSLPIEIRKLGINSIELEQELFDLCKANESSDGESNQRTKQLAISLVKKCWAGCQKLKLEDPNCLQDELMLLDFLESKFEKVCQNKELKRAIACCKSHKNLFKTKWNSEDNDLVLHLLFAVSQVSKTSKTHFDIAHGSVWNTLEAETIRPESGEPLSFKDTVGAVEKCGYFTEKGLNSMTTTLIEQLRLDEYFSSLQNSTENQI